MVSAGGRSVEVLEVLGEQHGGACGGGVGRGVWVVVWN